MTAEYDSSFDLACRLSDGNDIVRGRFFHKRIKSLLVKKKLGDKVEKGEPLAYLYSNDKDKTKAATERFLNAYTISQDFKQDIKTVYARVTSDKTVYF